MDDVARGSCVFADSGPQSFHDLRTIHWLYEGCHTPTVAKTPLLRFVVDLLYNLLYNKSTRNRSSGVWVYSVQTPFRRLQAHIHVDGSVTYCQWAPKLRLPSQHRGLTAVWWVPNYTAWRQRRMCEQLTRSHNVNQRESNQRDCDSLFEGSILFLAAPRSNVTLYR